MLTAFLIVQFIALMHTLKITKWQLLTLFSLFALFVSASVYVQRGGLLLYGEADWFLIDHNTPERSLLNKILAPHKHDADQYLARELTHFVEHIDARFIHLCTLAGYPHFMSIMTYAFLCGIALMFWIVARKEKMDFILSLLLIGLYFTAAPIFLAGTYIRPGHAHATFWAAALVLFLYTVDDVDKGFRRFLLYGLTLAMVWADRQGLFMAAVLVATLVFSQRVDKLPACAIILCAVFTHVLWNVSIGPEMVARFTDFKVGRNYQGDVVAALLPTIFSNGWNGFCLALNNLAMLAGNVSLGIAGCFVAIGADAFRGKWWKVVCWFVATAVMYALVLFHQTALMWPDLYSTAYYLIFATTMFWLVLAWVFGRVGAINPIWARWIIGGMIVGNVSGLPGHLRDFESGHMQGFIAGAPFLKAALKEAAAADRGTNTNRYDVIAESHFIDFQHIMKNPIEYQGQLTGKDFAESSQYLQWFRSEKGLPFGKGGR